MAWGKIGQCLVKVFTTSGDDVARTFTSRVGTHATTLSDDLFNAANRGFPLKNQKTLITANGSYPDHYVIQGFNRTTGLNGSTINRYTTTLPNNQLLVESVSSNGVRQAVVMDGNRVVARAYGQDASQQLVKNNLLAHDNGRYLTGSIDGVMQNQGGFVSYLRYV